METEYNRLLDTYMLLNSIIIMRESVDLRVLISDVLPQLQNPLHTTDRCTAEPSLYPGGPPHINTWRCSKLYSKRLWTELSLHMAPCDQAPQSSGRRLVQIS